MSNDLQNYTQEKVLNIKTEMIMILATFVETRCHHKVSGAHKLFHYLDNYHDFMDLKVAFAGFQMNVVSEHYNRNIECDLTFPNLNINFNQNKNDFLIQIVEEIIHQFKFPYRLIELARLRTTATPTPTPPQYLGLCNSIVRSITGEKYIVICNTLPNSSRVVSYSLFVNIPNITRRVETDNYNHSFTECPICLNKEVLTVVKTNCNHLFCKDCFDKLVETCISSKLPCPMCRTVVSIVIEEIVASVPP
jgi:hypothetical protein